MVHLNTFGLDAEEYRIWCFFASYIAKHRFTSRKEACSHLGYSRQVLKVKTQSLIDKGLLEIRVDGGYSVVGLEDHLKPFIYKFIEGKTQHVTLA